MIRGGGYSDSFLLDGSRIREKNLSGTGKGKTLKKAKETRRKFHVFTCEVRFKQEKGYTIYNTL